MMTDSEIIRDALKRINVVLNESKQRIEVKDINGTYTVNINGKQEVGLESTDDVINIPRWF